MEGEDRSLERRQRKNSRSLVRRSRSQRRRRSFPQTLRMETERAFRLEELGEESGPSSAGLALALSGREQLCPTTGPSPQVRSLVRARRKHCPGSLHARFKVRRALHPPASPQRLADRRGPKENLDQTHCCRREQRRLGFSLEALSNPGSRQTVGGGWP